jgi:hypothetical protein
MSLVLAADVLAVSLEVPPSAVATGALTGLAYAVLAAGLVLVYRATRVINFAHGQIGALGAAVLAKLVLDHGWNFYLALALVLVMGGAVGAVVELTVVRRLFTAPRLVLLVATIGVAQLLLLGADPAPRGRQHRVVPDADRPDREARRPGAAEPALHGDRARAGGDRRSGLLPDADAAGAADPCCRREPRRRRAGGVSSRGVSTLVWSLAGVLSTLTFVLINPLRGAVVGVQDQAIGPGLLLRALAAALIGGLVSLPARARRRRRDRVLEACCS